MTLRKMIEVVLEDIPETRNSDIALMIEVWKRFFPEKMHYNDFVGGGEASVVLADLYDLPREDHVKRIRADFNSKGLYWPTDIAVAEARGINEAEWRKKLGYEPKQQKFLDL